MTSAKQTTNQHTRHLSYTPTGQIQSIKDSHSNSGNDNNRDTNSKVIAEYQYNHLRQRVAKTVYHTDKQIDKATQDTTHYLWDKGLLSAEVKEGKVIRRYVYLGFNPVSVIDYDYQDQQGKIHDKPVDSKVYSIHTDHLGTPKQITDQHQNTVWSINMNDFGEVQDIQNKDNFTFNLRFAGQYHDTETGYYYNYHRYYDPSIGRYLTSDPIGIAGGLNTYGYANNRPYEYVDVNGLLVVARFDIAQNLLTMTDRDTKKSITIGNVFTGGNVKTGQMQIRGTEKEIPIPIGRYYITDNPTPHSNPDWYGLLAIDGRIDDYTVFPPLKTYLDVGRSNFRLHPGNVSHGCVTIGKENNPDNWENDWNNIDNLLKSTRKSTVVYEEPIYSKKPNWKITLYGELEVINSSTPWVNTTWDKPTGVR